MLVPTPVRRPALLTALGCWVLAALLGAWYAGQHQPGGVDDSIADAVHRAIGEQSMFARVLTGPSHPVIVYPVMALVVGIAVFARRWEWGALAVAGPGVCVLLTELVFKPLIGRTDNGVLSYPSGHTVSAMAALGVAVLVISVDWPVRARWVLLGLLVVVWALLAIGLVGMDYHYFTDAVGGFLVAIGVVVPLAVLTDRISARRPAGPGTATPAGTRRGDTSSDIPRPASPR